MEAELQTLHASIPTTANARQRWRARSSVRLLLSDGRGGIGIGEAAPLAGMSPESAAEAREALSKVAWPTRAPRSLRSIARVVGQIDPRLPSARFAAETALLSLWTSQLGVPLWTIWADRVESLPVAVTLWGSSEGDLVESAREAVALGADVVKVKIGRPGAFDGWLLDTVRSLLPDAELRLDANGALEPAELPARLEALHVYRPRFLEEPAPLDVVTSLDAVPFPLAVDESLAGPRGHVALGRSLRCAHIDTVVLKPSLLGGLGRCATLAARARAAGRRVVLSHLMEGPIARAAIAHLALALGGEAPGLGEHPGLLPLSDGLCTPWIEPTYIDPPELPGLGLELRF
ncbi:MAG: hypothetical protein KF729_02860 [Sandaracinaceae bacterium]|nr:hypothetical protein [Sandaracinaceae bacterium]